MTNIICFLSYMESIYFKEMDGIKVEGTLFRRGKGTMRGGKDYKMGEQGINMNKVEYVHI